MAKIQKLSTGKLSMTPARERHQVENSKQHPKSVSMGIGDFSLKSPQTFTPDAKGKMSVSVSSEKIRNPSSEGKPPPPPKMPKKSEVNLKTSQPRVPSSAVTKGTSRKLRP